MWATSTDLDKVGVFGVSHCHNSVHFLNQLLLLIIIKMHVPFSKPCLPCTVLDQDKPDLQQHKHLFDKSSSTIVNSPRCFGVSACSSQSNRIYFGVSACSSQSNRIYFGVSACSSQSNRIYFGVSACSSQSNRIYFQLGFISFFSLQRREPERFSGSLPACASLMVRPMTSSAQLSQSMQMDGSAHFIEMRGGN